MLLLSRLCFCFLREQVFWKVHVRLANQKVSVLGPCVNPFNSLWKTHVDRISLKSIHHRTRQQQQPRPKCKKDAHLVEDKELHPFPRYDGKIARVRNFGLVILLLRVFGCMSTTLVVAVTATERIYRKLLISQRKNFPCFMDICVLCIPFIFFANLHVFHSNIRGNNNYS